MSVVLGAVADDFTGATDLANTLVKAGMRVCQTIGVPGPEADIGDADAVVVALKSRTAPISQALADSRAAATWLRARGASQIIFKYCSTFDSTPAGNIGPVADALMDLLDGNFAFVCPAFPENGRTIYNGYLFVGDQLLSDSSMKDHPLTPMTDSSLVRLMATQSERNVGLIPLQIVRAGPDAIIRRVVELQAAGMSYGVVDALTDDDLRAIGQAASNHVLVTGGSGVAMGLPANLRQTGMLGEASLPEFPAVSGRSLVLAGSCSEATRAQIAQVTSNWPCRSLDVHRIAAGDDVAGEMITWASAQTERTPVLIYSSADPATVASIQARYGVGTAGRMIEETMSKIGQALHAAGFNRIIVAGGETSGAVVSALGVSVLRIGPEIAPGVPWTEALGHSPLALALKSGNFGGPDFLEDAFALLP